MEKSQKFLYKTPQGAEGLLLGEAYRRQKLTAEIQNLFQLWGYLPVQTPVFDFYDLYAPFIPDPDKAYRLVDREGDLLLLRNDITLFLARAMGMSLSEGHTPLRVYYQDSILRHQDVEDISANEFFQVGAEFVGAPRGEGDWEIILLLGDLLKTLHLEEAKIHVGSRALFQALTQDMPSDRVKALQKAILTRNWSGWEDRPDLQGLFSLMGTLDQGKTWASAHPLLASGAAKAAWDGLLKTVEVLAPLMEPDLLTLDLSEIGRQEYYTGLVFQAYYPGSGDAIASGGRYDNLLDRFGLNSPSVGFSLMLGKVEALISEPRRYLPPEVSTADGRDFADRVQKARRVRTDGTPCRIG